MSVCYGICISHWMHLDYGRSMCFHRKCSYIIDPVLTCIKSTIYAVFIFGCDVRLMACHMATGFRSDVIIWVQCLDPLSKLEQPTITCPNGLALPIVLLFSVHVDDSGELTTVRRIWMAPNMYGGTLNIIASLNMGQLSARFTLVFFFDTFLSSFCK